MQVTRGQYASFYHPQKTLSIFLHKFLLLHLIYPVVIVSILSNFSLWHYSKRKRSYYLENYFFYYLFFFVFSSLRELNLEGNQLGALPVGALYLNLKYLRIQNNFTHPLMWRETAANQPQVRLIAHHSGTDQGWVGVGNNLPKHSCMRKIEEEKTFEHTELREKKMSSKAKGILSKEHRKNKIRAQKNVTQPPSEIK